MERFWRFSCYDHCRLHGRDFPDRVARAGFEVTTSQRSPADRLRYAFLRDEVFYIARRPA